MEIKEKVKKRHPKAATGESIITEGNLEQNLKYSELEALASEIKKVITNDSLLSSQTIFDLAIDFPICHLGFRKSMALMHEYKLTAFFTPELFMRIHKRVKECHDSDMIEFNESDFNFIINNRGKGRKWIAKSMYIKEDEVQKILDGID